MMDSLYKPQGVEERWQQAWEDEGLYNADVDESRTPYVDAHPPPNVTGELHIGHALQLAMGDLLMPDTAHAGLQRALPARLRPRRHFDAGGGREVPRARGQADTPGDGPRGVRGARLGVAPRVRRQDHDPVPAHGRLARLPARALHDGPGLLARGAALLRAPVREGLDLPGQPDHQLVPVPPHVAVRPRARARGRGRHADDDQVPARRRQRPHRDRDRAAGDDPGRRRGGRAPGRRALQGPRRQGGDRPVRRAARADHRRRARRARVRHRRTEDHAGPRPDRLRDRPRPWAARAVRDRAGRAHEPARGRARRADAGGSGQADPRLDQGARPARLARALPALGGALRALRVAHRATHLAPVVVLDGRAQEARAQGAARPQGRLPPRVAAPVRDRLARERSRLVHLAPDLVGAPDPDLVLPGRAHRLRRDGAGRLRRVRLDRADPGDGRARHVVLVGALAVRDARLAGSDSRPRALLSGRSPDDGPRDHPPLGEPHDLLRARADRARSRSAT